MPERRKTKIIVTLGPSSMSKDVVKKLIHHGMEVLRINMNHGDYSEHEEKIKLVRSISSKIPVMVDLTGLSIRTRIAKDIKVKPGDQLVLGRDLNFNVDLLSSLEEGQEILIEDGTVKLKVVREGKEPVAEVVYGKEIRDRKNVNFPGMEIDAEIPTEKDKKDLEWAINKGVEIFAVSFVNKKEDIKAVRDFISDKGYEAWIIAKIETKSAVKHASVILKEADGIMVARGDLALEIPLEKLPITQKQLINLANKKGKPAIVATQLLSSMVNNPMPTRAEISDIANAVFDGASALMLSNETSIGKYPIEAVKTLARIIKEAEKFSKPCKEIEMEIDADAVAIAAFNLAEKLNAKFIVTPTMSGRTPRRVARFRPKQRILAIASDPRVVKRVNLLYATDGYLREDPFSYETLASIVENLRDDGKLKPGDYIVAVNVNTDTGHHLLRVLRA